MIEVFRIPVLKDRLKAMPKDERVFLLSLGYSANQLSMLQKLAMFSANLETANEVEETLSGSQCQMVLRLTVGVLNETWLLIDRRFNQSPMARKYAPRLDPNGRQALADLKRQFGASNILSSIRNDFAFHYPKDDDVERAFAHACNDAGMDDLWHFYFSHFGFNSFFLASELVTLHGIRQRIGAPDLATAQARIMSEVTGAVANVFEFTKAFVAAAWLQHFGSDMPSDSVISIKDATDINKVWVPFFVDMDADLDRTLTLPKN